MNTGNKIYKKNVRAKTIITAVIAVLLVCLIIIIGIFFWFRRYIVYTSDGLYLDVPWLSDTVSEETEAGNDSH